MAQEKKKGLREDLSVLAVLGAVLRTALLIATILLGSRLVGLMLTDPESLGVLGQLLKGRS